MNEDQKLAFANLHAAASTSDGTIGVSAADVRTLLDLLGPQAAAAPAADPAADAPAKKK